jgi:hypothetical protein
VEFCVVGDCVIEVMAQCRIMFSTDLAYGNYTVIVGVFCWILAWCGVVGLDFATPVDWNIQRKCVDWWFVVETGSPQRAQATNQYTAYENNCNHS